MWALDIDRLIGRLYLMNTMIEYSYKPVFQRIWFSALPVGTKDQVQPGEITQQEKDEIARMREAPQ